MRRREFITSLGGAAAAWPLSSRGQQIALPIVGFVRDGSAEASRNYVAAFRRGLSETGYFEGQNLTVEYHWVQGEYDRLPRLMDDLVRRQVAVIVTPGGVPTHAAAVLATSVTTGPVTVSSKPNLSRSSLVRSETRMPASVIFVNTISFKTGP